MNYPKEFIEKIKAVYPDFKEMHRHADAGSVMLGRYLDDSSSGGFYPDEILKARTLEEIQNKARIQKQKLELYTEWCKLYDKEFKNQ